MTSKEKAYTFNHGYSSVNFEALFNCIDNIKFLQDDLDIQKTVFSRELWVAANLSNMVITADTCGKFAADATRLGFLLTSRIKQTPFYQLTKFGYFISQNIKSQPKIVWDAIHVHHLILYRIDPKVEYAFSAFYNISVDFVNKFELGKKFTGMEVNQEVLSKILEDNVGLSNIGTNILLQWLTMLEPTPFIPKKYIKQPTNYCSIERTYYALAALYTQYKMSLGTPLLFDERTINDIKLYLLVPESEIIPQLRLLQQTYPDFVEEQSSHWGTSFVLNKFPDVPFPWLN